jgi:hypothetical protein
VHGVPWKGPARALYRIVVDGQANPDAARYYPYPRPLARKITLVLLRRGRSRLRKMSEDGFRGGAMRILCRRDLVCRQAVELVTDYLEAR